MFFNSFEYLVFFSLVAAFYFLFPYKYRWIVVLIGCYYFYMSWKPVYGFLLFVTTFVDWSLALLMSKYEEARKRKRLLLLSIAINLSVLFFFKYFNFITTSFWDFFIASGEPYIIQIVLPIGISFYTFQSMAYMIDVYRGRLLPERNFGKYAAFVSFFPHLVSGPILRPANIIPQFYEEKKWNQENVSHGLYLIGVGLFKKVIIADRLAFFVNTVYGAPELFSGAILLIATYFFAFQIYSDFSGYTDIAIGSARILGYTIPDNFRQPYFSATIPEFWRRWNISLSTWLRDYLYIPLGGSREGTFKTYRNLFITMLLGGLWHGAAWTFVFWGSLQGVFLSLSKCTIEWRDRVLRMLAIPDMVIRFCRIFITFNLVCLGWIFFRAASFHDALYMIRTIFTSFGALESSVVRVDRIVWYVFLIIGLIIFDVFESRRGNYRLIRSLPWYSQWAFAYAVIMVFILFGIQTGSPFIYFQF